MVKKTSSENMPMNTPNTASRNFTQVKNARSRTFGPMLCSCFFSYSYSASRYSYSKRPSIAIRPIGPRVPANRLDQRSASPKFEQPSSTSTVSLSTASLSTSTTKSDARHQLAFLRISLNPVDRTKASCIDGLWEYSRCLRSGNELYYDSNSPLFETCTSTTKQHVFLEKTRVRRQLWQVLRRLAEMFLGSKAAHETMISTGAGPAGMDLQG
jgi:hypothetical protein